MAKRKMTYADALNAEPDGQSKEELYEEIVSDIKKEYNGNISDVEAHEAARNLIGFVKEVLEINVQNA